MLHAAYGFDWATQKVTQEYTHKGNFVTEKIVPLEALMQLALAGDKLAYTDVLHETARFLRHFLTKRVRHASEVDDLLQEILLSIHKARHTYDGERPYKPWAFAIAKFRLLDYLRAHYADHLHSAIELSEMENHVSVSGDSPLGNVTWGNVTESSFTYESIREEIQLLPEKQATILQMMHQEGCTAKEVAAKIGMKESAVKVAAHRAYKVLRKRLGENGRY